MIRSVYIPKVQQAYIKELLTLTHEELMDKYGFQNGKVFSQTIVFTESISVEVFINLDETGTNIDGRLKEKRYLDADITNVPYQEGSGDFFGNWKFVYNGEEYVVSFKD